MRHIDTIHIHHSASTSPIHDDIEVIREWHLDRGFNDVGYHYYLTMSGRLQIGRPLSNMPASIKHHNEGAIAICLGGRYGISKQQKDMLIRLVRNLVDIFNIEKERIFRHKDLADTECPSFDIHWLKWEIFKNEFRRDKKWK